MGIISRLRAIDDRRPDEERLNESARLWWAFLAISATSFGGTTLGLLLLSSDVRFLIPLATAVCSVPAAFLAGFQFNNHLRGSGRTEGGWPGFWVLPATDSSLNEATVDMLRQS